MANIGPNWGSGQAQLQVGQGDPDDIREVLKELAGEGAGWQTGVAVAANTVTLSRPGLVVSVEATTATSAGVKTIQFSGSPAAGAVQVAYDAAGIPTLTFNGTDAVTEAAIAQAGGPTVG